MHGSVRREGESPSTYSIDNIERDDIIMLQQITGYNENYELRQLLQLRQLINRTRTSWIDIVYVVKVVLVVFIQSLCSAWRKRRGNDMGTFLLLKEN